MPFNGSGVFQRVRNWVADATAGIKIRADFHDAEDDGFAGGLSNCITKDGQTIVTQNIPMNSKRITGLADPVNPQDAATKAVVDLKMPIGGGTPITGNMEIEKASPAMQLDETTPVGSTGSGAQYTGLRVGKLRWLLRLGDGTPEPGADVGSDCDLNAYADDGTTFLGQVFAFNRKTGLGTVKGNPTAALGIATKQYADATYAAQKAALDPQLFAGIPVAVPGAGYTTVLTDAQKCISGQGARTIDNALAYPIGTVITFAAFGAAATVALSSGTLYWNNGGAIATGPRTISNVGIATAIKMNATDWIISGNGVT